jgi:hypothetical protein
LEPGTYLGYRSPNPTPLVTGKGASSSTTHRRQLRVDRLRIPAKGPPRDGSTTARSPSGERRPSVSDHVMALPLLRPGSTGRRARRWSLGWRQSRGVKWSELGFLGYRPTRWFCCSEDRSSLLIQDGRPSLFRAEIGPGGQAKCRPKPSPPSANSRQAGPDQNRSMGHFRLKYF